MSGNVVPTGSGSPSRADKMIEFIEKLQKNPQKYLEAFTTVFKQRHIEQFLLQEGLSKIAKFLSGERSKDKSERRIDFGTRVKICHQILNLFETQILPIQECLDEDSKFRAALSKLAIDPEFDSHPLQVRARTLLETWAQIPSPNLYRKTRVSFNVLASRADCSVVNSVRDFGSHCTYRKMVNWSVPATLKGASFKNISTSAGASHENYCQSTPFVTTEAETPRELYHTYPQPTHATMEVPFSDRNLFTQSSIPQIPVTHILPNKQNNPVQNLINTPNHNNTSHTNNNSNFPYIIQPPPQLTVYNDSTPIHSASHTRHVPPHHTLSQPNSSTTNSNQPIPCEIGNTFSSSSTGRSSLTGDDKRNLKSIMNLFNGDENLFHLQKKSCYPFVNGNNFRPHKYQVNLEKNSCSGSVLRIILLHLSSQLFFYFHIFFSSLHATHHTIKFIHV